MMRKKTYVPPEMNMMIFQTADIITVSGNIDAFDGEWVPIGGRTVEDDLG